MPKQDKRVHLTYYYWGLFFLSLTALGLATGKALVPNIWNLNRGDRIWPTTFITTGTDPIEYWFCLAVYAFIALSLFHSSMLFVGINRERLIEKEGFDRRVVGFEKPVHGVSIGRVLTVCLISALIISGVCYIHIAF